MTQGEKKTAQYEKVSHTAVFPAIKGMTLVMKQQDGNGKEPPERCKRLVLQLYINVNGKLSLIVH